MDFGLSSVLLTEGITLRSLGVTSLITVGGTDYRDAGKGACSAVEDSCERTEVSRGASTKRSYFNLEVVRELTTAHRIRVTYSKTSLIRINGGERSSGVTKQKIALQDKRKELRALTNGKFDYVDSADLVIEYQCINSQNIKKLHDTYI